MIRCARCGAQTVPPATACWWCHAAFAPPGKTPGEIAFLTIAGGAFVGVLLLVVSAATSPPPPPRPTSGTFALKSIGCPTEAALEEAQTLANKDDWMGTMQVMVARGCAVLEPGVRWEMKDRGWTNSLVYAYPKGLPERYYVKTNRL